jgi:opacity protein-like surface antigen
MNVLPLAADVRARAFLRVTLAWLAGIALAWPAAAQGTPGGFANIVVAAAAIEHDVSPAITAGIGYRFNRSVGVGVEVTAIPNLDPEVSQPDILRSAVGSLNGVILPSPLVRFTGDGGHATIFTANLRLELPRAGRRLVPYLVGGGGVGSLSDRFELTIDYPPVYFVNPVGSVGLPVSAVNLPLLARPALVQPIRRTLTGFAMTFGGGVSFMVGEHFSIDGDARYMGILGTRDVNSGRAGGGVSYRF